MLAATVIRRLETIGEISKEGKRLNGLFRLMEHPILWVEAYARIYANAGAVTKGINDNTLDGFSDERVSGLIDQIRNETYRPQPVRRVYIPKKNGKKRPLGVPTGNDKLVQEVIRIILERIYEPLFSDDSHGFRPGRSPLTALQQIEHDWTGTKWIVDMDIQGFFDNMNHEVLMRLLEKKIDDARFLHLVKMLLKAGYLEDWKFQKTYSGTPQGGICSPILSNIYLHELDDFMKSMIDQFRKGKKRTPNPLYRHYTNRIARLRKAIDSGTLDRSLAQKDIVALEKERRVLPAGDPLDQHYRRLLYCRYADDFVIGVIGSKKDAELVKQQVKDFLETKLKLKMAEEKSSIAHAQKGVGFLGYTLKTHTGRRIIKIKRGSRYTKMKSVSEQMQLHIPKGRLEKFCKEKGYGNYQTFKALHRPQHTNLSEIEIISIYNAELLGLANYYALAKGVKSRLNKPYRLWQVSLFKTLAAKRKRTVSQIARSLRLEDGSYGIHYQVKGETRTRKLFRTKTWKMPLLVDPTLDQLPRVTLAMNTTELIKRLNAHQCEYCEATQGPFEVHHVRGLKSIEKGKELWQRMMMARRRKTLVLCRRCHKLLTAGKLPPPEKLR
jgi:group II intron reverse transcriptase/maturase